MDTKNIVKKICVQLIETIGLGIMIFGFLAISNDSTKGIIAIIAGIGINATGIFLKNKFTKD
ncbi:hypothetical protein [Campylobacter hyointestinalis]|uniref:hypothetical protein n=1 Tax=Campylobacter hyointestinalis TaxID=198 RepID=UPI0007283EC5|nr:hypothetical protein [Campylobacter hyointestinalis]CUU84483.1 Uncharacterised protein [Campylobacter hyointestinalis subsp. hyointestinalis]